VVGNLHTLMDILRALQVSTHPREELIVYKRTFMTHV
jgi:hypothetical protein